MATTTDRAAWQAHERHSREWLYDEPVDVPYYAVQCGWCDLWHTGAESRRAAATGAAADGWRRSRDRGWLCPDCGGRKQMP